MKLAQTLTLVYCVFGVVWCRDFFITLPDSVEAVRGLCVLVSCAFEIGSGYENEFKGAAKGVWRKDGTENYQTVFDSSTPETNQIKGEIRGDLTMKNCTTIFYSVSTADSGRYFFRIERGLKYTYKNPSVQINVGDSPPKPILSMYLDQTEVEDRTVLEGSSVTLICSALAPCPSNPPTLTWSPLPPNSIQEQNQNTSFISSHLIFTVSHLHHGVKFNCSATYRLENNTTTATQRSVVLRVQYPPRSTSVSVSPSGPILLGRSVSLSCSSDGNPAVIYTWYRKNGEQIGTGDTLTITATDDTHSGLYYCRAQNQHGTQNSSVQLDVQYPPRNTSVSVSPSGPVLLGRSVSLIYSSDGNPAVNYTWYRENGEQIGTGDTLTITETDDTHSGLYYCRAENQHGTQNSSVQLDVQYAPQVSLSSHCNGSSEGGIECVCEVHGFPVPKLEWHLSGRSLPPSANSSIREERLGKTGVRSFISIRQSPTDTPTLQCISSNNLGSTAQLFHAVAPGSCSASAVGPFHFSSLLVGAAIGASAVMLLCTIYVFRRRAHHKPSHEENAGLVLNDRAVCQDDEEESLYCNRSSKQALSHRDPDILHYSTISFPNGEEGSGEIRGLSSLTPEYATVQHGYREQCEGEIAEDVAAGDEETKADETVQPSEEEVTYGNIVRHKTALPDVDVGLNLEQTETTRTEPEQHTPSDGAEGLYAEVKHKPELRALKR